MSNQTENKNTQQGGQEKRKKLWIGSDPAAEFENNGFVTIDTVEGWQKKFSAMLTPIFKDFEGVAITTPRNNIGYPQVEVFFKAKDERNETKSAKLNALEPLIGVKGKTHEKNRMDIVINAAINNQKLNGRHFKLTPEAEEILSDFINIQNIWVRNLLSKLKHRTYCSIMAIQLIRLNYNLISKRYFSVKLLISDM